MAVDGEGAESPTLLLLSEFNVGPPLPPSGGLPFSVLPRDAATRQVDQVGGPIEAKQLLSNRLCKRFSYFLFFSGGETCVFRMKGVWKEFWMAELGE